MKKQAILIAGMHRSGTSALTRVISMLGADLPKKLLPAMKGVNESGFWESEDLVTLHEELLVSAGSFWDDWSEFNQDWYLSAVGVKYRQRIVDYIKKDFGDSDLFVIKDPRICRFLPIWLDTLHSLEIDPIVILPVRNPYEVAYSLRKRDGFSVPKGLLIWLRYVLDAIFYSLAKPTVFVAYDSLLTDWKGVVDRISQQGGVYFPLKSTASEFNIDSFLDVDAKHNFGHSNSEASRVAGSGEIAFRVFQGLVRLTEIGADDLKAKEAVVDELLNIRQELNHSTLLFSPLVYEERLTRQSAQLEVGRAQKRHDEVITGERESWEAERMVWANQREGERESWETERMAWASGRESWEAERVAWANQREGERESWEAERESWEVQQIAWMSERESWNRERDRLRSSGDILSNKTEQLKNERNNLRNAQQDLGKRFSSLTEETRKKFDLQITSYQSEIIRFSDLRSKKYSHNNLPMTKKQLSSYVKVIAESGLFDCPFYNSQCAGDIELAEECIEHYLREGVFSGYDPSPLFSTNWYLDNNKDVLEANVNPLLHFIESGWLERRSPHPLFDVDWYLESYPDVLESGQNPLSHYILTGYKEVRNPSPLFDGAWYWKTYPETVSQNPLLHYLEDGYKNEYSPHPLFLSHYLGEQYPVVRGDDISALECYYRFGSHWGWNPHPLFDGDFYREKYSPPHDVPAILHFLADGQKHLLDPSVFFDSSWYLESYPEVAEYGKHPLFHYLEVGSAQGFKPNPYFDPSWYRAQYSGLLGDVEPLTDYVMTGCHRGRNPAAGFDNAWYLEQDAVLAAITDNALHHYIVAGRLEGRKTAPDPDFSQMTVFPYYESMADDIELGVAPPADTDWAVFPARMKGSVNVIVPVYKGFNETLNCIHSVLSAKVSTEYCLTVINDASPDFELTSYLEKYAELGLFEYVENDSNQGFVGTVNRGMMMHPESDVILLNADTEVYDSWLDKMLAVAGEYSKAATITPLSNNATICSYPFFPERDVLALESDYAEFDLFTEEVNQGVVVEAPTGVGFCMYIRRKCLEEVGLFDEEAFGRGYGEENDFCQRALVAGWNNLITADTFVRHWGGASFQEEKQERIVNALQVLNTRHPTYSMDVDSFIRKNPLLEARERLDWRRLIQENRSRNIMIICHNRGGGTERHVMEDADSFVNSGYGVYFMRPDHRYSSHVAVSGYRASIIPNIPLVDFRDAEAVVSVWEKLNITDVHTHGLVDFLPDAGKRLAESVSLYRLVGGSIKWEVNIHDYKVICPRITLTDENGVYCGEPDTYRCNLCLKEKGSDFAVNDIVKWREIHNSALQESNKILVPDEDVKHRIERYYPDIICEVSPHEELAITHKYTLPLQLNKGRKLRVVIIGAISRHKGFDVLSSVARFVRNRKLPIEFILLGYSLEDPLLKKYGVTVLGEYVDINVHDDLVALDADIVWLPSVWPETYSYTLSLALEAQLPVAAFDIGAIARRLRSYEVDELLMPLEWRQSPELISDFFMKNTFWPD